MITTHRIVQRTQAPCDPSTKTKGSKKTAKTRNRRERYNHPKKQVLAARILDTIEERGGMTSTQIKKQLFLWAYPDQTFDPKRHRGWWSDPLYGGMYSSWGPGLLKTFCDKVGRKWVRNKLDHEGHPWRVIMRTGKTWTANWTSTKNWSSTGQIIMTYGVP